MNTGEKKRGVTAFDRGSRHGVATADYTRTATSATAAGAVATSVAIRAAQETS